MVLLLANLLSREGGFHQVNAFLFALGHLSSMCGHYIQVPGQGGGCEVVSVGG